MSGLSGYRRGGGDVGIRNHVVVLSLSAFCNRATDLIARTVRGTIGLTHPYGRNEIGLQRERLDRSLEGFALNGNVYGVLVVGYEPTSTERFIESIRDKTSKPIERILVLDVGTPAAVSSGIELAASLARAASATPREPIDLGDLTVGVKCGGSDSTSGFASNPAVGYTADRIVEAGGSVLLSETTEIIGAEHILARRAVSKVVASKIVDAAEANERAALAAGIDLVGVNPVPDNIRGGISTIEEKSLGAILKAGHAPIQDVLGYGERPMGRGLYFMDSPSAAAEVMTGMSAAGAQLILFSTGTGNPVGSAITPVLKVTGNPRTASRMRPHVDVDISGMLTTGLSLEAAGEQILAHAAEVVNGALTAAELLGHAEFAPIPVGL